MQIKDDKFYISLISPLPTHTIESQEMLNEVLRSVVTGRPIWSESLFICLTVPKDDISLAPYHAARNYINWTDKAKV